MKNTECPVCGCYAYLTYPGEYDQEEWGQGKKLTPDYSYCNNCGFSYEEHINCSEEEAVKRYKRERSK